MPTSGGGHRLREDTESYRRKRDDEDRGGGGREVGGRKGEAKAYIQERGPGDTRKTDRIRCTHAKSYLANVRARGGKQEEKEEEKEKEG